MARIIVDYPDSMHPVDSVEYIMDVVKQGQISVAAGVPHFCWATTFKDGTTVWTRRKKKGQTSDSFRVMQDK